MVTLKSASSPVRVQDCGPPVSRLLSMFMRGSNAMDDDIEATLDGDGHRLSNALPT